mmetsp:Transcript_46650/g.73026  ORF Transcript_46650/g.73026 Transcript_46650/m.73026 type:complete len:120 (-) Transcript_46650:3294-3653(-)
MGKVKTKTVKKSARFLVEKYYDSITTDFQLNKKFCDEVALIPSKSLRNKIAGFVTHLAKRLNKGRVNGINLNFSVYNENSKIIIEEFRRTLNETNLTNIDLTSKKLVLGILNNTPQKSS